MNFPNGTIFRVFRDVLPGANIVLFHFPCETNLSWKKMARLAKGQGLKLTTGKDLLKLCLKSPNLPADFGFIGRSAMLVVATKVLVGRGIKLAQGVLFEGGQQNVMSIEVANCGPDSGHNDWFAYIKPK